MARKPTPKHRPTEELIENRDRFSKSSAKLNDVQGSGFGSGGGREAPLVGRDKPTRVAAPTMDRAAKSAKQASGGAGDYALIEGSSDDVLGIKNARVRKERKAQQNVGGDKKGRSDGRIPNLDIPVVRASRLATEDGRTSFHFSHDSITKTRNAVVDEKGRANRPGAAKAHNKYIERESAVALDENGQEIDAAQDEVGLAIAAEDDIARAIGAENDNAGIGIALTLEDEQREGNEDGRNKQSGAENRLAAGRAAAGRLRAAWARVGGEFSWSDDDPRERKANGPYSLHELSPSALVSNDRQAEMLLYGDADPVVGRRGEADPAVRSQGTGDRGHPDEGKRGWLMAVPAFLTPGSSKRKRKALYAVPDKFDEEVVDAGEKKRRALAALAANDPQHDLKSPDGHGKYIERQEALAIQPDGTKVLFTNIDKDPNERAEFWKLVEENEVEAGADRMTFVIADNHEFWKRVAAHPQSSEKLVKAINEADPNLPVTVDVDDNVEMRKFLSGIKGWKEPGKKLKDETQADFKARVGPPIAKFQDGRGGRVQYRIIGELPFEIPTHARAGILKEFSAEFEKRNLPFVSVMHAPDHTNDARNWHFHLVYYDRPCSRVTEQQVQENATRRNEAGEVKPVKPNMDHVGLWDFAVSETYLRPGRYEKRTNYPYRQEKDREINSEKWIGALRERLAEITNDHLEEYGVERRVDARRHSEMGIHSDPQEHLGTRLANMEAMGVATPTGVSNEERQWAAIQEKMERDAMRKRSQINRTAEQMLKRAERSQLSAPERAELGGHVTRWVQHQTEAEEHGAIAENLDQHMARMVSRAEKVKETCERQLEAIDNGKATKFQTSRRKTLSQKAELAIDWLTEANIFLAEEKKLAADCRRMAEREGILADDIKLTIERMLAPAAVQQRIEDAERRQAANENEQRVASRQRDAQEKENTEHRRIVARTMDQWVQNIERLRRRLVFEGKNIVPANKVAADLPIVNAPNYGTMQAPLRAIKAAQDKAISDVVHALIADPSILIRQQRENNQVAYAIISASRNLNDTLQAYGNEPAIVRARDEAIRLNQERRQAIAQRDIEAERPAPAPRAPVAPAELPLEQPAPKPVRAAPEVEKADKKAASATRAVHDRIAEIILKEKHRVQVLNGTAFLSDKTLEKIGIMKEDVEHPDLQKRLVGMAPVIEREVGRLTQWAKKYPKTIGEAEGRTTLVGENVPADLKTLAKQWLDDQALEVALKGIKLENDRREGKQVAPAPVAPAPVVQAPRPELPQEKPQAAPAPVAEPKAPAPIPEAADGTAGKKKRPRLADIETDYELQERARRTARQRNAEARANEERAQTPRPTQAARPGETAIERAARVAAQQASTRGSHQLIDRWLDGLKDGMPTEDRRRIAYEIASDREARQALQNIDRNIARRINEEAQRVRDDMQPQLGLDNENERGPKR